jgi:hypothetical protein
MVVIVWLLDLQLPLQSVSFYNASSLRQQSAKLKTKTYNTVGTIQKSIIITQILRVRIMMINATFNNTLIHSKNYIHCLIGFERNSLIFARNKGFDDKFR